MRTTIEIAGRRIGPGEPVYIVAEMSANHAQDLGRAERILRAAKEAGADAVKLQTYTADTMTIDCDSEHFRIRGTPWAGRTLYELYGEAFTPWEWQPILKKIADDIGIQLFSTPFDATAVEFLDRMGVPAFKIASFENVDIPLLEAVAQTGKPVIVSTGMATLPEIEEAVRTVERAGGQELALLKCTSAYPAPVDELNLRAIGSLAETFNVPVGFSDHSIGPTASVAAVALGACIIEKHVTVEGPSGPDSSFSMEATEFADLVSSVRSAERMLGAARFGPGETETSSLVFRRSLFVVEDVRKGAPFTVTNVRAIRPGYGLHTRHFREILGRRAAADIGRGTPLSWDLVAD